MVASAPWHRYHRCGCHGWPRSIDVQSLGENPARFLLVRSGGAPCIIYLLGGVIEVFCSFRQTGRVERPIYVLLLALLASAMKTSLENFYRPSSAFVVGVAPSCCTYLCFNKLLFTMVFQPTWVAVVHCFFAADALPLSHSSLMDALASLLLGWIFCH